MKNAKTLSRLLPSAFLAVQLCGASADEIATAGGLAAAIETDPSGTYVLTADIDCSSWTTIDGFSGTLDGAGHRICNLAVPLFGSITGSIAIKNVVVADANVSLPAATAEDGQGLLVSSVDAESLSVENVSFTGSTLQKSGRNGNVGFVAGRFKVTSAALFKNCSVDDTCSFGLGVALHGGIVGRGTATGTGATIALTNCTMAAALSAADTYGSQFGGIAGGLTVNGSGSTADKFAHLCMDACTNRSGVASAWDKNNRGFAGLVYSAASGNSSQKGDAVISRCANHGSWSGTGTFTTGTNFGGLLGSWTYGKLTMEGCVNYGDIVCTQYNGGRPCIGGMVGAVATPIQAYVTITGCANRGRLAGQFAGGMIGTITHTASYTSTKTFIRSCMNTGELVTLDTTKVPGQAVCMLASGVKYPEIDIEGGLWASNTLIGTYAEGASVTVNGTDGNIYLDASDGLADGTDLAALNAYGESGALWKQGSEYPILGVLPDEDAPDTVVATFEDADGTVLKRKTIARGWYVFPPEDPVREGSTFTGWNPGVFTGLEEDATFVAQYASGILSWTVSFADWDGTPLCADQTVAHGGAATAPEDPVREGYIFTGWSAPFDNVTEDLAVAAQYVAAVQEAGSAAELAAVLAEGTLPGVFVRLTANIELPKDWTAQDFAATLDGCGHAITCPHGGLPLVDNLYGAISNLVIDASSDGAATDAVLQYSTAFGAVARHVAGGAVCNVRVANLAIKTGDSCNAGFMAGTLEDGGRIEGCTIDGTCLIRGKNNSSIGGVAGVVRRTSAFSPQDGEGNAVAGETLAIIADCTNNAPLQVSAGAIYAGGIAGNLDNMFNSTYSPEVQILRCVNNGPFSATQNTLAQASRIGGIAGIRQSNNSGHGGVLRIAGCVNNGDLDAPGASGAIIGGIVGYLYRGCETDMDWCVNRGRVGTPAAADGTYATACNHAGGLLGYAGELYAGNPVTAANCANYGAVAGGTTAGGLAGGFKANAGHSGTKIMFRNCANYGAVSGTTGETSTGQIFGMFGTKVEDSQSRQYGAVNCFFVSDDFYADDSGSTIVREGLVTAADEDFTPNRACRALNAGAAGDDSLGEWVLGRVGGAVFPELGAFATQAASIGLKVILK